MTENHKRFISHLKSSHLAVETIAQWLRSFGNRASILESQIAPSADQWKDYADNGDIMVEFRVEAKGLSCDFTSADDWPFKDYIVCGKEAYDRARPKPLAIIAVNRAQTHAGIVYSRDCATWSIVQREDRRYTGNLTQLFYVCDVLQVKFVKVTQ